MPSTAPPTLWVLNLDAEHELEAGRRYAPTRQLEAIVTEQRRALFAGRPEDLVRPGDLVLADPGTHAFAASGPSACLRIGSEAAAAGVTERIDPTELATLRGRAWSPTPRARALLAKLGARIEPGPDAEVLARVNARPFASAVRAPLVEGSFAKHLAGDLETALELLARPAPLGWLVRRSFGAAGRGRRRIEAAQPGGCSAAERGWLVASLRRGPLVIEPWVAITAEFTRSGLVRPNGEVLLSGPCFQATTAAGAWTHTELAGTGAVTRADDQRLAAALEAAGRALAEAGYQGPFGIDAFRHRDLGDPSKSHLNPLSEINARYTMDWALAMGRR